MARPTDLESEQQQQQEQEQQQHELLSLHTFEQGDFDVSALVSSLTEQAGPASNGSTAFDPAPLASTFESAVDALLPLRDRISTRSSEAERAVSSAERAYTSKLTELKSNFEAVQSSFTSLESRISQVGQSAIRIGDQLESIDRLKARASDASDLIRHYFAFSRGDTSSLEAVRKQGGRDGRAKVAVLARRLLAVARDVEGQMGSSGTGEQTRDAVEKYCEKFEKDMLKLFDRYYRNGDPRGMAHCAKTLLEFNGGQSCVQMYVNQHDYFISQGSLGPSDQLDQAMWEALPDPNSLPPKNEPKLAALYSDLRDKVSEEASIIQAVFPNPPLVMQVFLQRVFAQVIQVHIEQLITTAADSSSSLANLRILHLAHQMTFALVQDLKSIDLFKVSSSATLLLLGTGAPQMSNSVAAMLDSAFEELFVPYLESARYLDKEANTLNELYASYLLRFLTWHKEQNKGKPSATKTVFDKFVNQIASSKPSSSSSNSASNTSPALGAPTNSKTGLAASVNESSSATGTSLAGIKALMKLPGSAATQSAAAAASGENAVDSLSLTPQDGAMSLSVAERMLRWHAEAVGRMVDLSAASEVPKNAFTLLRVLTDSYSRAYVDTALDTALTAANSYDSRSAEPDLNLLSVVHNADVVMSFLKRYVSTALLPLAGSAVTLRREMTLFTTHIFNKTENKLNQISIKVLDNILAWLATLLGRQKKTDYRTRNDDLITVNSDACVQCCAFLKKVLEAVNASSSGKNREHLLTEVGLAFHAQVLDHLKKFQVSATGGFVVTKDLGLYQDAMAGFNVPILAERFDMLRQLGNIFVVGPDSIKAYLSESTLAKIDPKLLRPFLMQRMDYGDYSRAHWDEVCGGGAFTNMNPTASVSRY